MITFILRLSPHLKSVLQELELAVVTLDVGHAGKVLRGADAGVGPQRLQVRNLLREGVRVLSVSLLMDEEHTVKIRYPQVCDNVWKLQNATIGHLSRQLNISDKYFGICRFMFNLSQIAICHHSIRL